MIATFAAFAALVAFVSVVAVVIYIAFVTLSIVSLLLPSADIANLVSLFMTALCRPRLFREVKGVDKPG